MPEDKKNLTDAQASTPVSYGILPQNVSFRLSYTKTNKLITALYMVTDIMDRDEPLRSKLRTLGTEVMSDTYSMFLSPLQWGGRVSNKIAQVLALLEVAQTMNMVSEMNHGILKKEFSELSRAINQAVEGISPHKSHTDIADLFREEVSKTKPVIVPKKSIGHTTYAKLGVQKAGTLMKALSDRVYVMSDSREAFDNTRKQRREEIVSIIKGHAETYPSLGGATITDIRMKAHGELVSCSEKTLQRELAGMVTEGILNKTGSKRWSRYSLSMKTLARPASTS